LAGCLEATFCRHGNDLRSCALCLETKAYPTASFQPPKVPDPPVIPLAGGIITLTEH
jgi:hypothetical protein